MAIAEVYVRPLDNDTNGDGSLGDPFGDLEDGIKKTTFDTTNGTRMNIMAGTTETLTAELGVSLADTGTTAAWAPSNTAPCVFQGMTLDGDQGDGGQGVISGGGSVSIFDRVAQDNIHFADLRLTNTGSALIINLDNNGSVVNVEFDTSTHVQPVNLDLYQVVGCYFHNLNCTIMLTHTQGIVYRCKFIDDHASGMSSSGRIYECNSRSFLIENIMWINTIGVDGIIHDAMAACIGNSIFQNAVGTGNGIQQRQSGSVAGFYANNLIEGFSGTGGAGILSEATNYAAYLIGNALDDNTLDIENPDTIAVKRDSDDNEALSASPFTDGTNKDFAPVDTGNVKEGSKPEKIGNFA